MTQPKYPAGTLLRHRASGEKVLVTWAEFLDDGSPMMDKPYTYYILERGFRQEDELHGDEAVDLRYERVEEENPLLDAHFDCLRLSVRASNCLDNLGIATVRELVGHTSHQLLECRQFGASTLLEVRDALRRNGLSLKGESLTATPRDA